MDNRHWTDEMKRHFLEKANDMVIDPYEFYLRSRLYVVLDNSPQLELTKIAGVVTSAEERDDGIYVTFDTLNTSTGVTIDAVMEHTPYGDSHVLAINGFVQLDESGLVGNLDIKSLQFKLRDFNTLE